ncbi:MAG TPA: helix-turn-helix domain-containing protein, partial [Ktedonobacterales bacterium]|nr:helix-turn-helix domain-containing protein [Ktedonobacterales bacterium]
KGNVQQGGARGRRVKGAGRRPAAWTQGKLTPRQMEIVRLAQDGMRPAAIARTLCLSVATVRRTIASACLTFDAHGLIELLAEVRRRGLLSSEDLAS